MPRYAIIQASTVENVIVADATPSVPGRAVVALAPGQGVSPGDSYSGGTFVPRALTAEEAEREQAGPRLAAAQRRMEQAATQAQAAAEGNGALSLEKLTAQHRQIAAAVLDLARDLQVVIRHQASGTS